MFKRMIQRVKNDESLFRYLANAVYKFFNVIERNDKIISRCPIDPKAPKIFRIIDMYDNGCVDVVCDQDLSPMREVLTLSGYKLHAKFFKGSEHLRSATYDNGWRAIGGILANIRTGEVLKVGKGSEGLREVK